MTRNCHNYRTDPFIGFENTVSELLAGVFSFPQALSNVGTGLGTWFGDKTWENAPAACLDIALIADTLAMGMAPIRPKCAAKTAEQLEFNFVNNLGNPKFVLYKSSEFNPSMLRPGEYTLNLPWLRNEALDWAQNQQALQRAMNIGNPIREANPNALGGWLQRERDFMSSQGWQRTQQGSDVFWARPSGQ
jgi:hypothetical protein